MNKNDLTKIIQSMKQNYSKLESFEHQVQGMQCLDLRDILFDFEALIELLDAHLEEYFGEKGGE